MENLCPVGHNRFYILTLKPEQQRMDEVFFEAHLRRIDISWDN